MNLRNVFVVALMLTLGACGGGDEPTPGNDGSGAAGGGFGDVAFSTYEVDRTRVVFATDTKATKTWANMSGGTVTGTYTKNGNEIEIQWDPAADNHGSLSEKFRQMGPCSLARYVRVDKKGVVHDDDPQIFEKTKPRCDTVRVTN